MIDIDNHLKMQLRDFNKIWKEQDDLWREVAKKSNLPETSFWILYILVTEENPDMTQALLCDHWHITRQTCNSAIKRLEHEGLLALNTRKGAGNVKYLTLTDQGHKLADEIIMPLIKADIESFRSFTEEERRLILSLTERQLKYLKKETKHIL